MTASFDLRISVTGLCLFVPDPKPPSGPPAMHVLLPAITDAKHLHYARLLYDTAYEARGAKQLTRRRVCVPLDRHSLVPPVPIGGTVETVLTDEIVNLTTVTGKKVPRPLLDDPDPGTLLAARLSFRGGATTDYELGHLFDFVSRLDRMTWKVEWTIRGLPGDRLEWSLQPFGDASLAPLPLRDLYPIGGVVRVSVHNVMCRDLPRGRSEISVAEPAEHFPGYYGLFGVSNTDTPMHAKVQVEELSDCACTEVTDDDDGDGDTGPMETEGGCGCKGSPPEATSDADAADSDAAAEDAETPFFPAHILSIGGIGGRPVTCICAQGEPGP